MNALLLCLLIQTVDERLVEAYTLDAKGRPAEAVPIVREIVDRLPKDQAESARYWLRKFEGAVPGPPEAQEACRTCAELWGRPALDEALPLLEALVAKWPGTIEAAWAKEKTDLLRLLLEQQPSFWSSLGRFLFGTIIGWWILIVVGLTASAPLGRLLHTWNEKRRFIRNEGTKLANPQNAEVRHALAGIYFRGGRLRRAEAYLAEAMRIAGENPLYDAIPHRFLVLEGDIRYRRGRYAQAVASYERALQTKSDLGYGDVYLGLGRCALRLGEAEKALDWFRKSREERTSTLETYFRIAQAAKLLGRADEVRAAREEFARTAANLPKFARQSPLRWRLAFFLFPMTRRLL